MRLDDEYKGCTSCTVPFRRHRTPSSIEEAIVGNWLSSARSSNNFIKQWKPQKKSTKRTANNTSTPSGMVLQDEMRGIKARTKLKAPSSATSYGFLLVALLFYLVSIFTCAFLSVAKYDNKVRLSWSLIFLPLAIERGIIFCHLGAIICRPVDCQRKSALHQRAPTDNGENAKQIFYWISCEPSLEFCRPYSNLAFVIWLEVNLFRWVSAKRYVTTFRYFAAYLLFLSVVRDIFGGMVPTCR